MMESLIQSLILIIGMIRTVLSVCDTNLNGFYGKFSLKWKCARNLFFFLSDINIMAQCGND